LPDLFLHHCRERDRDSVVHATTVSVSKQRRVDLGWIGALRVPGSGSSPPSGPM